MPRPARLAVPLGTAACVLGLSKAHAVAHGYDFTASARFAWALAYVAVLGVTAYGFGLPDLARGRRAAAVAAIGATGSAALAVSAAQLFLGDELLPRSVVLGSAMVLVPWYVLAATGARDGLARAEGRDRVVVVAAPEDVDAVRAELRRAAERPAVVVGALTPDEAHPSDPPARPLVHLAHETVANVVVLDRVAQSDEHIVVQAALLHEAGVRIRTLSLFYEQWLGKLPVSELERVSLLFDIGEVHAPRYARLKRLLDVVLAAAGVVALAVVTPFVLVGNALGNRGPLLYTQDRTGRGGRPFRMVKFRTMREEASDVGSDTTLVADPRVTSFGRLLRRTHLDELPQVLNVVRGELSIVGPRPEQPHLVERLSQKIPFYPLRHLVRPGLTGWAQVKYPYGEDELDALEKLQYEFFYLRRQGLGLDVRIVMRTLRHVLGLEGR